jgi:hypothetical protein
MSTDDNSVRVHDYSLASNDTAQLIKNVASDIRKSSSATRDLVHNLVSSGAFEEIIRASVETTIAIRDTVNEINHSIRDLKQRGLIKDTAAAILETTNAALDTIDIAKTELDTKKSKKNIKRKTSKS